MWTLLLMLHLCKLWGKGGYIRGLGSGVKPISRISREEIQEQLQTTQKEVEEERCKRESVESKLILVKNQLEEELKNREVMEARLVRDQNLLVRDQKLLKEGVMELVSHMQSSKNGLPAQFSTYLLIQLIQMRQVRQFLWMTIRFLVIQKGPKRIQRK